MSRRLHSILVTAALFLGAGHLAAQEPGGEAAVVPPLDSITVVGNHRLTDAQIIGTSGFVVHQVVNYRDVQRAIQALFATGQFDDVAVDQGNVDGRLLLTIRVKERPILRRWAVRGPEQVSERKVRDRVKVVEGRPIDRAAVAQARASIDSLYQEEGYYQATVEARQTAQDSSGVVIVFDVHEGERVAIAQVTVDGNTRFDDGALVKHMKSRPEGFFWWQNGRFDDRDLEDDLRERLPRFYADHGYIDFQVRDDTLVADSTTGKATLSLTVDEGARYYVGQFDIDGNRRFSSEELSVFYPFQARPGDSTAQPFNRTQWEAATEKVSTLYHNNGYIYAQVNSEERRRTGPDGQSYLDLAWSIREGSPATINKINIVGNDVTHERVIRDAIVLLPGSVFNQDRLLRSYQNISNLGFFQQPLPFPDIEQTENGIDVDITFRVQERRTGNINFGASLGQGTGIGGFLGLEEPNLFGRGKRGRLQYQFGRNINDFTLSYSDPSIRESRISGTLTLFNSRQRFTIGDLGRRVQTGGSLQLGFPFFGSRYTRLFTSYGFQRIRFTEGSSDLRARFNCNNCSRSTLGMSLLRDTRIDLPFPTAGGMIQTSVETNGGILGGTGRYQKLESEGRWYAPLGSMGGNPQLGTGVRFVLGLTAKSGFIFGDAGPFFTELYSMGGTQFGVPLRGYDEFSITPDGFDAFAAGSSASPNAFGKSYAAFTLELGARVSQSVYTSAFLDAGNVYRSARQYDPSRLYKGAGFGVALVTPLGPIGIDLGYGFDKLDVDGRPAPGWKLHFKLGNFF